MPRTPLMYLSIIAKPFALFTQFSFAGNSQLLHNIIKQIVREYLQLQP